MLCIARATDNPNKPYEFEVQDEWDGKWDKTEMFYDILSVCRTMADSDVKKSLNYAMTTWGIEIGIKFRHAWKTANKADIRLEFKNSAQDELFKKQPSVLAYAYFPNQGTVSGKVVFNDDYIWDLLGRGIKASDALAKGWVKQIADPNSILKTYSLVVVLIHELGHMLGLTHDVSGNRDGVDVMDAYYSGVDRIELSKRDLDRIHLKYSERYFKSKTAYERLKIAVQRAKLRL